MSTIAVNMKTRLADRRGVSLPPMLCLLPRTCSDQSVGWNWVWSCLLSLFSFLDNHPVLGLEMHIFLDVPSQTLINIVKKGGVGP